MVMRWLPGAVVALSIAATFDPCVAVGATQDDELKCGYLGRVAQSGDPYETLKDDTAADQKQFYEKKIFVANDLIDRYNYYACESYWYGNFWGFLSISVVILTAASSLMAAFNIGAWQYGKFVLAGTSAVAALMSTILIQFHIKDSWQLRENGQIAIQTMQEDVRNIQPSTPEALEALSKVHLRAIELERSQATQFFGQIASERADAQRR